MKTKLPPLLLESLFAMDSDRLQEFITFLEVQRESLRKNTLRESGNLVFLLRSIERIDMSHQVAHAILTMKEAGFQFPVLLESRHDS